ncbi:hypothetical protein [Azospirillum brasilense]|uniref:hypothetical protein n=1 Tax=Azospirillum brasilense TaxID=192 RepID=UPI0013B3AED4|nr:hypothetical protein [Azospirillum brasilense]
MSYSLFLEWRGFDLEESFSSGAEKEAPSLNIEEMGTTFWFSARKQSFSGRCEGAARRHPVA